MVQRDNVGEGQRFLGDKLFSRTASVNVLKLECVSSACAKTLVIFLPGENHRWLKNYF